ncbi:MAG: methylenetetrahydrofolate reductase [Candidatus Nitrosopumilus limneticus]|nr:Methylenetetrahydrofolate reductase (NAD(P)H) [Candidatus Nitrosopumilus limneticus]MDC4212109.1 methylenetetrahydrofolate reductase [Candidatus Nitrosopumilus limneticus]MDC4213379.1 methylenetetrahydrofolate reductase [Candidatus Nitrosopumilus limneticus]MDC4214772.1 methylenetetrahydrofolate reductase [Candidatus Nitrosopumilus limneticus]MDC4215622.1 methylenetetrahydrofolate reductase [Candidatus Nitrosopumilus limneticus]
MTIRYEANPPKILLDVDTDESIKRFIEKIKIISKKCDAIHLTENVLGHQRVSPIKIGEIIKKEIPNIPITVSLRVRDKNEEEIEKFVDKCISIGITGILIIMGDPSQLKNVESGLIPSDVVSNLKKKKYDSKIELYLSISNKPNFLKIEKKIKAEPKGFMTQVIQNIQQVQTLADNLKQFSIIPIILFPSEKNQKSADFLGLNLEEYNKNFDKLVKEAYRITGDVLITSPNDFNGLKEYLEKHW